MSVSHRSSAVNVGCLPPAKLTGADYQPALAVRPDHELLPQTEPPGQRWASIGSLLRFRCERSPLTPRTLWHLQPHETQNP